MGVEIEIRGVDENLRRLVGEEKRVRNTGLKMAAKAVAERLKQNTPVSRDNAGKHMKDDIKISRVDQNGEIMVGFGKETYWRAHFVEMGTIKQRPQGFIQRTEEEMRNEVFDIMVAEFRRGLGL